MNEVWFSLDYKSDLKNVLNFLEKLPDNMFQFINSDTSNFFSQFIEIENHDEISEKLFLEAFNEAREELNIAVIQKRRQIKLDILLHDNYEARRATEQLRVIGFTGSSLQLKARLLNRLWRDILDQVDQLGQRIIDFANNQVIKLVRKFLNLLNSILNSLKVFIPPLDGLKEIKEVLENYLTCAEDG